MLIADISWNREFIEKFTHAADFDKTVRKSDYLNKSTEIWKWITSMYAIADRYKFEIKKYPIFMSENSARFRQMCDKSVHTIENMVPIGLHDICATGWIEF